MHNSTYLECSSHETTEEILCKRQKVCCVNNRTSVFAQDPYHWSNIPSGSEYQRNLEEKYPGMRSGPSRSEYDPSFPYQRRRPAPQKPASDLLLYSNTKTYSYSQANTPKNGNANIILQNRSNISSRGCHDDDRIRKALKHIDNASKILENY